MVRREAPVLTRAPRIALAAALASIVALLLLAPLVPEPRSVPGFRVRAYGTHAVWFALVLVAVALVARAWHLRRMHLATLLVLLAAGVLAGNAFEAFRAVDPVKVVLGGLAGTAFVRALERPWWLLPICVLVPAADAWSVFSERGVTKEVVDRAAENPEWILWPTIATPIAGYDYDLFGRLGIVDLLFAGVFLGAAARWRWPAWRGVLALLVALLATSVLVFESAGLAIPALPLLCLGCLVAYGPWLLRDARDAWRGRHGGSPAGSGTFPE